MPFTGDSLLNLDPVPRLLKRVRSELAADFDFSRPIRISRAPGRLDVMGGIADYTGAMVCETTLDRAAAVALQERADRELQVFSFNLLDEHKPFTLRIPLDSLAMATAEVLRREFSEPGRKWAAYLVGCLYVLHEAKRIDLSHPRYRGLNLALYSTVPLGAGVSSSAAVEVAVMMNLLDHFLIRRVSEIGAAPSHSIDPLRLAELCQSVEHRIVGAPCGIMDQVTSCCGDAGSLLRMICQPHDLLPQLGLPAGVRVIGINSHVRHEVGGSAYARTRCAAFMGHRIILEKMREIGAASGRILEDDPMNGYLANLNPDDYKHLFRPHVPEWMKGREFIDRYGGTIDPATCVEPDMEYPVQHATDHHVLEARRVRRFVRLLEEASSLAPGPRGKAALDRAGHLMYASHLSYTRDAMLGADEYDLLVRFVREREHHGLYGARITGGGSGGTVAVLAGEGDRSEAAIDEIMAEYQKHTGWRAEAFTGTSPGAWHVGTTLLSP